MATFGSYDSPRQTASKAGISQVTGIDPGLFDIVRCEVQKLGYNVTESEFVAAELIYAAKLINPTNYKTALRQDILKGISNNQASFDKQILDVMNKLRLNESKLDKESIKQVPESVSRTILY